MCVNKFGEWLRWCSIKTIKNMSFWHESGSFLLLFSLCLETFSVFLFCFGLKNNEVANIFGTSSHKLYKVLLFTWIHLQKKKTWVKWWVTTLVWLKTFVIILRRFLNSTSWTKFFRMKDNSIFQTVFPQFKHCFQKWIQSF